LFLVTALDFWQHEVMTTTARARVRTEITSEIKAVARRQLAREGSAALSLRAVAREVGMVSSAVYRYFPSRDDLLTALIVDAYDAVGAAAEAADPGPRARVATRWLAITRAVRAWAHANPQEYALIYGSPVPGYLAPETTIDPATRVSAALLGIIRDGVETGEITADDSVLIPRALRRDLAGIRTLVAEGVPDEVLTRALFVWAEMFGAISLELFGHLHNVITDFDASFDLQMRRAGALLVSDRH
jgi:AcrR family transcriptional regulator